MLYMILKHVIWRLRIYTLFLEIFKFRDFKEGLLNFAKYIVAHIFATFKYFAKQTIYSDSPDHVLQNKIQHVSNFKKWPKFDNFAKIAHKIAKSKYFVDI